MRFFTLAAVFLTLALSASSQVIPGRDAYRVTIEAVEYPNGFSTPERSYVVTRPKAGTYFNGVVMVKTRAIHGMHRGNSVIDGSSANAVLSTVNVADVSSVYNPPYGTSNVESLVYEKVAGLDRMYAVRYSEPLDPFDLCKRLMESPDVEYAVPVYKTESNLTPNDPRYANQPWLKNMGLEEAWDVTQGSDQVLIAIVDSGTDWQHEDLSSRIWTNPGEIPNNNKDDDGNGYVDDVRGWDFVGNITELEGQQGVRRPDNDPRVNFATVNNQNGHGTFVAGCAAAHTNNATGVASPGFNCKILPIKCGSDNAGVRGIYDGYNAIRYAADLGADIINCSWGGPGFGPGIQEIIDYAAARGALVVAASGNDGLNNDEYQQNPASLAGVLSVGAVDNQNRVSNFANYGWGTYVYAPGNAILSTRHGNGYGNVTGTSFSSPLTSGVCGLVKALHPDWTPEQIREQIRSTTIPISGVDAANRPLYFGSVNANNAVRFNNQGWSNGQTIPGIKLSKVTVESGTAITSYNPTNVAIELKNILGDAKATKAQFTSRTDGVTFVPASQLDYGDMPNNTSKSATLVVQLNENFPWYEANLTLEVAVSAGSYFNYILVEIPVKLPTSNVHQTQASIPGFEFSQVDVSTNGSLFATGTYLNTPVFVRGNISGGSGFGSTPFVPLTISAINTTNTVIGGDRNNVATISSTTNGGTSWNNTSVANLMSSVEGIKMYTSAEGMAIGNGTSNRFAVVRTTNGGTNWQAFTNPPLVNNAQEKIISGSVFFLGDAAWFATSERRVIFTTNKGQSFSTGRLNVSGAEIISVAFRDNTNGTMLYRTGSSANSPKRIASSADGGVSWTPDLGDPAQLGIDAIAVESSGGHHLLIGSNGEVFGSDNNGADWQPVLSRPSGLVTAVSVLPGQGSSASAFFAGSQIANLTYRYSGPNGVKTIELTADTLHYDTVEVSKNRVRYLQVRSTGESGVRVDSVVIEHLGTTPDSAFREVGSLDPIIEPGTTDQIGFRCYATDTGRYTATVRVYTNATTPVLTAHLVAYAFDPTTVSVNENVELENVVVGPNPTSDVLNVQSPLPTSYELFNNHGQIVETWTESPQTNRSLSVKGLPSGAYTLVARSGRASTSIRVVIAR